jgi:hypothetical protein
VTDFPQPRELSDEDIAALARYIHATPLKLIVMPVLLDAEQRQRLTAELLEQMVPVEKTA